MQPISTSANWNSALLNLDQAEQQQNIDELQVSSGEVSQNLGGYGQSAETITSMEASQAQLQGFITAGNAVTSNLTDQATALTQVANGGAAALQAVNDAISSGSAAGLMQTLQSQYQQVVGGLNAQSNGVYIFGGGTTQPPVSVTSLSGLTALASPPTAAFQNGQFASSAQIDQSTTIQTGMLANNVGTSLFTVFQNIAAYDAGLERPARRPAHHGADELPAEPDFHLRHRQHHGDELSGPEWRRAADGHQRDHRPAEPVDHAAEHDRRTRPT